MKYLVTSAEIKEYDNNTIERIGIPTFVLMERAAMAVRDEILDLQAARENAGNAFRRVALMDPRQTQVKWKEAAEHVDAAIQKMKDSASAPTSKKTTHRRGRRR